MTTHNDIEAGNKLTIRVLPTREWPDDRITIQIRSADQIVTVRNDGARNKAGPSPDRGWSSMPVGRYDAFHQILEGFLDRLLAIMATLGVGRMRSPAAVRCTRCGSGRWRVLVFKPFAPGPRLVASISPPVFQIGSGRRDALVRER